MNPLKRLHKIPLPFRDRRYVYIVFFILLCVALIQSGSYFVALNVSGHWEELSAERTQKLVDGILSAFNDYQNATLDFSKQVSGDAELGKSLSKYLSGEKRELVTLFDIIERHNAGRTRTIEVYDRSANCVAWSGRRVPTSDSVIQEGLRGKELSAVSQGFIYSYFSVLIPMRFTPNGVGAVMVVSRTVEVNFPLHNRFLHSSGLASRLSAQMNAKVEFDFSANATESKDGRIASGVMTGIDGSKIGMLYVTRPARSSAVQQIEDTAMKVTVFLIVLLSLIMSVGIWSWYRSKSALSFMRFFVLTITLLIVRYLWLLISFPTKLVDAEIFNPAYFASPFGYGIARNPGELLLSVLFLFIDCVYLAYVTINAAKQQVHFPQTSNKLKGIVAYGLIVLLALFFALLIRGYGATLRSLVFDSTLRYNDPNSVLPSPMLASMELSLFLLTVSLILCSIVLLLLALRASRRLVLNSAPGQAQAWIEVVVIFAVVGSVLNALSNAPVPPIYQLVFTVILTLAAVIALRRILLGQPFTIVMTSAVLLVLSTIIVYPLLHEKVYEYQREEIQVAAGRLVQPEDGWMTFLLKESMSQMSSDENLADALQEGDNERFPALAFQTWAASRLSREGCNAAVVITDTADRVLSRFSVGIPERIMVQFLSSLQPAKTLQSYSTNVTESRGRKEYVGESVILNDSGNVTGAVWILLPARENVLSGAATPEILRSDEKEGVIEGSEDVVISECIGGELSTSTSDDFPRGYLVPDAVYAMLNESKSNAGWIKESIEGNSYSSYYILAESVSGRDRLFAFSIKELDFRWQIFDFFKIALFFLATTLVFLAGYFVFQFANGKKYNFSFRDRLLTAFLVVSVVPTLLIWFYVRDFTLERSRDMLRQRLSEDLAIVKESLSRLFGEGMSSSALRNLLTNDICRGIADETGKEFNVYVGGNIVASSRPEVYQTELLDRRLSNQAYLNVALLDKRFHTEDEYIGRFPYLVGYEPIVDRQGELVGIISLPTLYRQSQIEQEIAKTSAFIFGGYAIVLVLVIGLGMFLANRISLPIKRLTSATRRISRGELDVEVLAKSSDELGALVESFNNMIRDLKESRKELAVVERELAWREMAKQVAHEIKNPLTPMKLSTQHLQQAYRDKAENFEEILGAVTRTLIEQIDALGRIASEFSRFAKMPERQYEQCAVNELLLDVVHLFDQAETGEEKDIDFQLDFSDNMPAILADREELRRVFINIVRNGVQAVRAVPSDQAKLRRGKVSVRTGSDAGFVRVTISDNGCGIADEVKQRLFEPNFSTKTDGMGLGLAISRKIIDDLNGRIEISSEVGKGTRVSIVLPIGST